MWQGQAVVGFLDSICGSVSSLSSSATVYSSEWLGRLRKGTSGLLLATLVLLLSLLSNKDTNHHQQLAEEASVMRGVPKQREAREGARLPRSGEDSVTTTSYCRSRTHLRASGRSSRPRDQGLFQGGRNQGSSHRTSLRGGPGPGPGPGRRRHPLLLLLAFHRWLCAWQRTP